MPNFQGSVPKISVKTRAVSFSVPTFVPQVSARPFTLRTGFRSYGTGALTWLVGGLCATIGALMLVAPNEFDASAYVLLRPYLTWWGAAFFLVALFMASLPLFSDDKGTFKRALLAAPYVLGGALLIGLAGALVQQGNWIGIENYALLGIACLIKPWLQRLRRVGDAPKELVGIVIAVSALTRGVLLLTVPQFAGASTYALSADAAWLLGWAFSICAVLLIVTQLIESLPHALEWVTHWALAAVMFGFLVVGPWHFGIWTSAAYYCLSGALLLALPWLGSRLSGMQATSLRTRLALALVGVAALPLIGGMTFATTQAERDETSQALAEQQTLATVLAEDIGAYAETARAIVSAIALQPGLASLPAKDQASLLKSYQAVYADVFAFSTYDADGNPIARGDDLATVVRKGEPVLEDARRTGQPAVEFLVGRNSGQATFIFGAPIKNASGGFAGLVTISVPSTRWVDLLATTGGRFQVVGEGGVKAYLVDDKGKVLAHPDPQLNKTFPDLSQTQPVSMVLGDQASSGSLTYTDADHQSVFVGYSRVAGTGWNVVVERLANAALATVHNSRREVFQFLIVAVVLAAGIGLIIAGKLASPLAGLSFAVARLAAGDDTAPLPSTGVQEVSQLSSLFGLMRDRLSERTREREQAEQLLRESESRYRSVVETANEGIMVVDERGVLTQVNPRLADMLGRRVNNMLGRPFARFVNRPSRRTYRLHFARRKQGASEQYELTLKTREGTILPVLMTGSPLFGPAGEFAGEISTLSDITEHKEVEQQLTHQALHDDLTGLPNRALLLDRLQQAILVGARTRTQFSYVMIDLDRFKEVNDTFGHRYGDFVLESIGHSLRGAVREVDTVARLGGDEFAVILPSCGSEHDALRVAQNLLHAIQQPLEFEGQPLDVSASLGIAIYPQHGRDIENIMHHADIAMYSAKRNQEGTALYGGQKEAQNNEALALIGELRFAIDAGELQLHYQPKLDIKSGQVYGVEALVRWDHPQHGMMPPAKFIPLAERTGLIRSLTEWVLREAISQCKEWLSQGRELAIAVNLSMRDLDHHLPPFIQQLLEQSSIPPRLLCLEITESMMMLEPERTRAVVTELHEMGVTLSIDDFGTGYSSLSLLKGLPVHEIKVDASFVRNMALDVDDRVIVRSTIELGHNLGLRVVAEGIEAGEALDMLANYQCDQAQGYFVGRPMDAAAFDEWLEMRESGAPAPALRALPA
ncbi:MAG: EAL domain-containing protein [Chloroflexi bacterium]|nr:EAL domain-containing protein [Chloroflexota bacterium]